MNRKEERQSKPRTPVSLSKSKEPKGSKTASFNITSNFTEVSRRQFPTKNPFELQFQQLFPTQEEQKPSKLSNLQSLKQSKKKGRERQDEEMGFGDSEFPNEFQAIYQNDLRYLNEYKENTGKYENCGPSLQWPYLFTQQRLN